ncbi:MAG: 5-bromo-4-chloroindolyl phosphate hydrolysis family protein [Sulfitobacter dubius]|jgi:tRNA U34 5-methylaminomethyl-2-thiouridine-forming methyltransferase MnmC|uniref:5-bromo-4-chloroindolyl phosphate hydrolysis family protein n=1 Tax=Sulfitobacter dubius TaxID=218673 RepID=UPI0008ED0931|nr:5-bromo-4-chloroindolyl phosphate hydrolysis family protein [Sulfitobacter dubius]SFG59495.1 5-bromo-4-chloroindolyl phosphate hydrolysis protein [Sulfitobacter dubius]
MARRFGGRYSPDPDTQPGKTPRKTQRLRVDPAGGRVNLMFLPPIVLAATSLMGGAGTLVIGLAGAFVLASGVWLLREGLLAEAEYNERKVARRPAWPRKIFAALLAGLGTALAAYTSEPGTVAPLLYGVAVGALHVAAFGIDPLKNKGMEGIDTFQQDRVARVVDEAEKLLSGMSQAILRAGDRRAEARLADFQDTARHLIRTVEEDPRDLTAARKYLVVYLRGAHDATVKFADLYARNHDEQARDDYLALLDDLDENFAARTAKSLLDDRSDLNVEIDVLRARLSREGVRLDQSTPVNTKEDQ